MPKFRTLPFSRSFRWPPAAVPPTKTAAETAATKRWQRRNRRRRRVFSRAAKTSGRTAPQGGAGPVGGSNPSGGVAPSGGVSGGRGRNTLRAGFPEPVLRAASAGAGPTGVRPVWLAGRRAGRRRWGNRGGRRVPGGSGGAAGSPVNCPAPQRRSHRLGDAGRHDDGRRQRARRRPSRAVRRASSPTARRACCNSPGRFPAPSKSVRTRRFRAWARPRPSTARSASTDVSNVILQNFRLNASSSSDDGISIQDSTSHLDRSS